MRELDQLLGWYLDTRYPAVDAVERAAFAELLEQQDPDLWNWLSGRGRAPQASWRRIVDEIRQRHCV